MPEFSYRAITRNGASIRGVLLSESERALESTLLASGYWLVDCKARSTTSGIGRSRATRRELIEFCSAMASMLDAGIVLVTALNTLGEESEGEGMRQAIRDLALMVNAGGTLSDGMQEYPHIFPKQIRNVVRAGEQSGNLPEVFKDLQAHYEWVDGMMSDVKQVSIYPVMVLLTVIAFIAMLFTLVVPKFTEILLNLNIPLPLATRMVIAAGDAMVDYGWLLLGTPVALCIMVAAAIRRSAGFAMQVDRLKFKLPVFGPLLQMIALSKLTHNLAMLLRSGIPMLEALGIARTLVGNRVIEAAVDEAHRGVNDGRPLSEVFREQRIFPSLMLRMIVVGEETGAFDRALESVSKRYDEEIPRRIRRIFGILEPAIMLFMIGLVGTVAMSIFMPLMSLMKGI